MSWGASSWLYALWALPALLGLALLALRSRRNALARFGPLIAAEVGQRAGRGHRARLALGLAAWALAILALAQPRWGYQWEERKREGLSLVVVLDVSSSMAAQDVSPSRMERAQRKILDLADLLAGDRVGLVLFAGGAYPRMPLTLDYSALKQMVQDSDTTTLKAQGSDLGAGIDMAAELLAGAEQGDRAILIVSDGEDQLGQAGEAAKRAADAGIHLYALGIGGTDGAPIPLIEGGFKKDQAGQVVLTRLDEDTLKDVARTGNGAYARASAGIGDLRSLYEDEIRGKLQSAEQGARREKIWNERYQIPLAGALLLGLLSTGPWRPLRRKLRPAAAILPLMLLCMLPAVGADQDPEVTRLLAEQVEHPGDLGVAERLGEALYNAGDYARAEDVLSGVASRTTDPTQAARARYNAGLAAYHGGRLTEAAQRWQQVVQDDPKHEPASQNLQAVQKELALRMQPKQDQPQSGQGGDQSQSGQDPQQSQQDQGQQDSGQQDPQAQNQPSPGQQDPQDQNSQQQAPSDPSQQQQDPGSQPQQQAPTSDGTRQAQEGGQDSGQPAQGAQAAAGSQDSGQAQEGEPTDTTPNVPGALSKQEADRLLDGVKEGDPRVEIKPRSRGGKDW